MLDNTTIRCILGDNSPISVMIYDAIGLFGNTRLETVRNIMASAMEEPIQIWFEEDIMAMQLPSG